MSIISQLTVVSRLGLCPFYVYWTHARGRDESCDGRCGLVHESPGSAALGELMFADPPKLYCCSGANPPCLEPANLQRATGYSSAAEWIESLPWCALPARQRPAPSPTPTIPSPPLLHPLRHHIGGQFGQYPFAKAATAPRSGRAHFRLLGLTMLAYKVVRITEVHPGKQPPRPYTWQKRTKVLSVGVHT